MNFSVLVGIWRKSTVEWDQSQVGEVPNSCCIRAFPIKCSSTHFQSTSLRFGETVFLVYEVFILTQVMDEVSVGIEKLPFVLGMAADQKGRLLHLQRAKPVLDSVVKLHRR